MTPDSTSPDFQYSGTDNLEVMAEAVNYNAFLANMIERICHGSRLIVDFGAGSGTFAEIVRAQGHDVACIEPDPAQAANLGAAGFPTFASCSEMKPASADAVYTLNVLEHIEDDAAAVRAIADILRPGGRLLVYVPAFPILYGAMDRKVGHVRRYRRRQLVSLLEKAGFTVEHSAYADSLGFAASLAFNAIGSGDGSLNSKAIILYDRIIFPISRLIDTVTAKLFGKNTYAVAMKPIASGKAGTPA